MPSRKQRRRREKERRHEYEVVYVDGEGRELDPEEVTAETRSAKESRRREAASNGRERTARQPAKRSSGASGMRAVSPPSWRRVLRRGAIFAPFMFLTLWLLGKGHLTSTAIVLETIWLLALFVPFSYGIDRMMYRRYLKQTGGAPPARQPRA
jgi:hypothetical protein